MPKKRTASILLTRNPNNDKIIDPTLNPQMRPYLSLKAESISPGLILAIITHQQRVLGLRGGMIPADCIKCHRDITTGRLDRRGNVDDRRVWVRGFNKGQAKQEFEKKLEIISFIVSKRCSCLYYLFQESCT